MLMIWNLGLIISSMTFVFASWTPPTYPHLSHPTAQSYHNYDPHPTPVYAAMGASGPPLSNMAESYHMGRTSICRAARGLSRRQRELCYRLPDVTEAAMHGLRLAAMECQHQFQMERWNCSALVGRLRASGGGNPYTSPIFKQGFKETAFAAALSSAGIAISIARACSMGQLAHCDCQDPRAHRDNPQGSVLVSSNHENSILATNNRPRSASDNVSNLKDVSSVMAGGKGLGDGGISSGEGGKWKWGGCSHNLVYGVRFAKMFLDGRETTSDIHSRVSRHNNQVGRKVVKLNMEKKCKCHGMSGSCALRTCWKVTPQLRLVGSILKDRYKFAAQVDQTNMGNANPKIFKIIQATEPRRPSLNKNHPPTRLAHQRTRSKRKRDLALTLLYYERSPNYCDSDAGLDVAGTVDRQCNRTGSAAAQQLPHAGHDSCGFLCCGRGHNYVRRKRVENCRCEFLWCCKVRCDRCEYVEWITVCK